MARKLTHEIDVLVDAAARIAALLNVHGFEINCGYGIARDGGVYELDLDGSNGVVNWGPRISRADARRFLELEHLRKRIVAAVVTARDARSYGCVTDPAAAARDIWEEAQETIARMGIQTSGASRRGR